MNEGDVVKVCMISYFFPPEFSGSAKQAISVAKWLRREAVEPFFVSARLGSYPRRGEVDGLSVFRLPVLNNSALRIPSFWVSLSFFLISNRNRIDVIHAHGTIQHSIAGIVGRVLGKPTILKIAMARSDIAFDRQGRIWGRIQKFLVSKFDFYVATSSEIEAELKNSGVATEAQIVRIPNGVDMERFSRPEGKTELRELRSSLGLRNDVIVLFVGVICARKNVDTIVKAWKSARDQGASGQLVCVGPIPADGDSEWTYFRSILTYIEDHDLGDSVLFTGYKEDPASYYKAATLFAFPSKAEGMPNAVLEAMASGLPCLLGNFSGAADMIRNGQEGWVIKNDEVSEYARRIAALATDESLLLSMSSSVVRRAQELFSLESVARRIRSLYSYGVDRYPVSHHVTPGGGPSSA